MSSIIRRARAAASPSGEAIRTRPSCSISILTPVSAVILLITLPPGPMTSRIRSGLIRTVMIRGAYGDRSGRGAAIACCITSSTCIRASRAWARALPNTSRDSPRILMSICSAVTPSRVPATLKSISPIASSIPWISVRIATRESAEGPHLADAVGGEIVVMHEALALPQAQVVDDLLVLPGSQRTGGQHLGLPPDEEPGPVHARQQAHLGRQRTDLGGGAAVGADAVVEDHPADLCLDERLDRVGHRARAVGKPAARARWPTRSR